MLNWKDFHMITLLTFDFVDFFGDGIYVYTIR